MALRYRYDALSTELSSHIDRWCENHICELRINMSEIEQLKKNNRKKIRLERDLNPWP